MKKLRTIASKTRDLPCTMADPEIDKLLQTCDHAQEDARRCLALRRQRMPQPELYVGAFCLILLMTAVASRRSRALHAPVGADDVLLLAFAAAAARALPL